jgi:hypothetical protein
LVVCIGEELAILSVAVYLDDCLSSPMGFIEESINVVGRPSDQIWRANGASFMRNERRFLDGEDVSVFPIPAATEKQGDGFLSVSWEEVGSECGVLGLGEAKAVVHRLNLSRTLGEATRRQG